MSISARASTSHQLPCCYFEVQFSWALGFGTAANIHFDLIAVAGDKIVAKRSPEDTRRMHFMVGVGVAHIRKHIAAGWVRYH